MKKRIIAVITALAITITAFTGITMPVGAEDLAPDEITITIGGQEYDPATSGAVDYKPGESFNARLSWDKIPEGVTSFTYHLGNHIKTTNTNGDINVNGTNVGTWKIVDGELIVEFNDNFNSVPNRNCWVNFDGTIPLDPNEQKQGDEYKVEFGDKEIDIKPQYGESDVYVGKSAVSTDNYSITVSEDGRYIVKNRITVTVNNNYASDITLSDVLGDCMTLPEPFNKDDVKLTYTPAENNSEPNSQVESGYTVTQNVNGFDVYLPGEFKVGDRITLEYETELTEEAVKNMLNGDSSQISGVNTASGTFTDVFTEKSKTTNEAYENLQVWKPTLTKSGTLNDDNTITWTVTFDPGFLHNILDSSGSRIDPDKLMEELQKLFGEGGFDDTLDGGEAGFQSFVADMSSLSITDFTRPNPYSSSYTIEFTTTITDDGDHGYYTNDAKLTLMKDVELNAHAAVGIGYGVEKEFVDETTDGKMQWKITIEVPEEATEFTELTINDNPYADNSVKSGYEHKLLPESIKVGGVSINETNGGIKLEENNIIITREYAQAQGWLGEFVEITLETEAVKNGSNNGSLEPNFRYINDVNYTVKYPDGTTGTTSARAEHSSITDVLYEKGGEVIKTPGDIKGNVSDWNAKTTSQVLWYVDVYDFAKYEYDYTVYPFGTKKSGYLFDPDGFEVDLTDTLPENMKLVANSWYAIPTVFAEKGLNVCEDPDVRDLFSQGLSITYNGNGTLSIRYELSDEARQKITAYLDDLDNLNITDQWGNKQNLINLFGGGSGLRLYYITEIDDVDKFIEQTPIGQYASESAEVTFTNTVFGSVNNNFGVPSQADVKLKRTEALAKTTKYSSTEMLDIPTYDKNWKTGPFGTQNIPFEIEVNPQKLSLGYDNGKLVIEDVMGTSLRIVEESIVITDYDTRKALGTDEYSVEVRTPYYGETDQKTRIIISMPDGRHLRVTYYAEIAEPPTDFIPGANDLSVPQFDLTDMTNEVHFYLEGSEESFSCDIPTAVVFTSAGAGYNSFLKLHKVDKDNPTDTDGIPGARFELRVVTLDPTSGKFTIDETQKPVQGTFSEDNATTYLGVDDPLHQIYQVVEVKAPDGFTPDPEPHYYVFEAYLEHPENGADRIKALNAKIADGKENVHLIKGNGAVTSTNVPEFSNEHAPEPVKEKLSLTKVLTGGNIADYARDFNFTLKVSETPNNSDYNLEITSRTASNDEYGNIDFGELTFHEAGTYVLTITEEKGNDPQITYDEKAITVTYNVTLDDTVKPYGALKVESKNVTYQYGGEGVSDKPSFTNTVKDMSVTAEVPTITKKLTGRTLKNGEFTFEISAEPTVGIELPEAAKNDVNGNVKFDDIKFTKAGTYVVTVSEVGGTEKGMDYDKHSLKITYTVEEVDGELQVTKTFEENDCTFENTYTPQPVPAAPTIKKEYTNGTLKGEDFEFTLEAVSNPDSGMTLPTNTTAKNDDKGNVTFGEITFSKVGTYTVKITETNGGKSYVKYATDPVTIMYTVTDTNNDGVLEVSSDADNQTPVITNEYLTGSLVISKTVEGDTPPDKNQEFTFGVTFTLGGEPLKEAVYYTKNGNTTESFSIENDKGTIKLKAGETATFNNLPAGTKYTVTETDYTAYGYTSTSTGANGEITANETKTAAFVNTYKKPEQPQPEFGSLVISKTVTGDTPADPDKAFSFSVKFDYPDGKSKTETFSLANGESELFKDIPVGTKYTVTETDYTAYGYTSTSTGANGEITANETKTAAFVNTYKEPEQPEPEVGSLKISKTVQGEGADLTKLFSFSVTFDYPDGKSKTETFSLANGESELFKDIPVGTKYTVTETDYTADGYTSTSTDANGEITANETKTAAFVNTYKEPEQPKPEVGSLEISKTVQGEGADLTKLFSFSVTFDYPDGKSKTETFSLANGESELFKDIPVGTKYTVTENFSEDHWTTTVTGENASGTIDTNGQEITVEFVNTYTKPTEYFDITVSKKVTGSGADKNDEFTFKVTFTNSEQTPLDGEFTIILADGITEGTITSGGTFTLKDGESVTIKGIPEGTIYTVEETDSKGYTVSFTDASGVLEKNAKVKFTNNKEKQEEQSSEPSTEAPPTTQPTQPAQTAPAPTETTTEQTAPAPVETTTEDDRNRVDGDSDSEDRQPNTANTADFGILLLVMAASCVFAAAAKKKAD